MASGFMKDEFKVKLEELKEKKATGEFKLAHLENNEIEDVITEEDIKYLLSNFSGYVVSRNMPECKNSYRTL
ncbi:hypothetical protein [Clostridium gasigenes]|uniref:hypothetical protein n=1 Tax=Clostridium gasigenes TaxID=94869 RepID=UPI00209AEEE9|nr:hypothetical protein [Clostridium gasigenes]